MTPEQLMKKYEKALASQDWSNVEPLMHDDICVTFSSGTFKGIQEVRCAFENNFSSIKDEEYKVSDLHWVFSGSDSAICLYHFHWQGLINGEHCSGGGRGTTVMLKASGEWKIIAEHLGPRA